VSYVTAADFAPTGVGSSHHLRMPQSRRHCRKEGRAIMALRPDRADEPTQALLVARVGDRYADISRSTAGLVSPQPTYSRRPSH